MSIPWRNNLVSTSVLIDMGVGSKHEKSCQNLKGQEKEQKKIITVTVLVVVRVSISGQISSFWCKEKLPIVSQLS